MDAKKIEFDITKLVIEVHNEIMQWHNNDFDGNLKHKADALKVVSNDIVQRALETILQGSGAKTEVGVYRGDVKVGDSSAVKDGESFVKKNESDIVGKLFDKKD
jgi:hypothetical protein